MKKINKKGIVKLIILVILLITQIKAFKDSRANNITYVTANIIDASGVLSAETSSIIAMNEGESGMAITLPDILNTKKVTKYIVTKKTIIETVVEPEEPEQTEEITTDSEGTEQTEETTPEPEEIEQIEEPTTEPEVTEQVEETNTEPETTTETIIEQVEKLPGEKVYLTQEEIENLEITLTVEYDTIEVNSETLYNKKLTVQDSDDYELLSVSGYMPYDTQIQSNEIDISNLEIDREAIKKKTTNAILVNIFILAYILVTEIFNVNSLLTSKDGIVNVFGIIALFIIPFTIGAVVEKVVAFLLVKLNKWKDKYCLIGALVIEVISFFTLNKIVIAFMVLNFINEGKAICTLLSLLIEGLSVYIFILLIKSLKLTDKKEKSNKDVDIVDKIEEIEE